jgi:F-type H+-transporting ATPase subunit b
MPQLNIADWPPQLFWLAVTFIALYFIISRIVIPRTGGAIESRKERIDGDLALAQKLKAETDAAAQAYEKELADARAKAGEIGQAARNVLSAEAEKERQKLDAELAAKIAAAEKSIAASRKTALDEVANVAAGVAVDIVDQLTGSRVTKADADQAVARAQKS